MPFIIVLMMGTSYAFLNSAGSRTNLMIQGSGEHKFKDYVQPGLPLTILLGAVSLVLAPLVFGF